MTTRRNFTNIYLLWCPATDHDPSGKRFTSLYGVIKSAKRLLIKFQVSVIEVSRVDDDEVCWPTVAKVRRGSVKLRPANIHHDAIW